MPKDERVVVVFVASPSDMKVEREKLEEVIVELNTTWSRQFSMRLDLVRWETHALPGIGTDPQDVINNEIPGDMDIFIGLMWGKFGTPTSRAGSGTEEEFENALARHRERPASVRIMFYFKDSPLPPSQIDADQLARVHNFRSSLGTKGTLDWSFKDLDEFERLIRMHLSRQMQHFHRQQDEPTPRKAADVVEVSTDLEPINEPGALDHLDTVETNFVFLTEIVERFFKETRPIEQFIRNPNNADEAAIEMTNYVARIKGELPLFGQRLNDGATAAGQVAQIMREDLTANDKQQVATTLEKLRNLNSEIDYVHYAIGSFRDDLLRLPRMTSKFRKANREAAEVLQIILDRMGSARGIVSEMIVSLDSIIEGT